MRPALVERDQEQIGEQHRKAEDDRGLALGALLLERRVGPLARIARRQRLRRDLLQCLQRLTRRYARRRTALNGHGAEVVVADQGRRTDDNARLREAAQRDHLSLRVAHIDAVDVVDPRPVGGLRLHLHLPGAAEQIHVVDEVAAERRLQRLEDVLQLARRGSAPCRGRYRDRSTDWSPRRW